MLWTITIILFILWIVGLVSSYTLGGWIHILLVLAIIVLIFNLLSGRRALYRVARLQFPHLEPGPLKHEKIGAIHAMNNDTVAGKFDQVAGKDQSNQSAKQSAIRHLANSGAADQVKGERQGDLGQRQGHSFRHRRRRETAPPPPRARSTLTPRTPATTLATAVTSTAENLKNSISNKLDDMKR